MVPIREDVACPAYLDVNLDVERRIDAAIAAMTLEEKLVCLGPNPSVPRLGLCGTTQVEGQHGIAMGGSELWGGELPVTTTSFPQPIGLACTWDSDCLRSVGAAIAQEARYLAEAAQHRRGGLLVRTGSAELARDPRWRRTGECFGEDPFLAGSLMASFVKGVQGNSGTHWMAAAVIPFFLGSSQEDARETSAAIIDEREFYESYSVPIRMAIEQGGCRAISTAYNLLNGIPCATHPLLESLVVREWGHDGIISGEAGSLRILVLAQQCCANLEEAVRQTLHAGTTQYFDQYEGSLREALVKQLINEQDVDRAVRKNFRVLIRLGLWDVPVQVPQATVGSEPQEPWNRANVQQLVRQVTQKSIVLLKNHDEALPLAPDKVRSIAVIGPLADRVHVDSRGGTPPYAISCVDGVRERVGRGRVMLVANNDLGAAMIAAQNCDVALVCVGNHPTSDHAWGKTRWDSDGKEDVDRRSLELEAEELVRRVHAANPNTVLILISSFPYTIEWSMEHVPAILLVPHCSQELGRAVSDVLFGDFNPAGRLAQTWPRSSTHLPPFGEFSLKKGRTYQYPVHAPLFPFGHGKSYSRFTFSRLLTSNDVVVRERPVSVSIDVTNLGPLDGDEVVQLYVRFIQSAVFRPERKLVAFKRVNVPVNTTRTIELLLDTTTLEFFDPQQRQLLLESGLIELLVGHSSEEIALTTVLEVRG